jgi:hypothetical protein
MSGIGGPVRESARPESCTASAPEVRLRGGREGDTADNNDGCGEDVKFVRG